MSHQDGHKVESAVGQVRTGGSGGRNQSPTTLTIDIGGTYIKAGLLDAEGQLISERLRAPTPKPSPPAAVLATTLELAGQLGSFDRVSVGFPGVVRGRSTVTAPNLDTEIWAGYPLADTLARAFGRPVRLLNDALIHGLGVVRGHGLECVITLGTGMGCALYRNGMPAVGLELGRHVARDGILYDEYVGQAAYEALGDEAWNLRVADVIESVLSLTVADVLHIGGGNARRIAFDLPPKVVIAADLAGITGGARLWHPALASWFDDVAEGDPARAAGGAS